MSESKKSLQVMAAQLGMRASTAFLRLHRMVTFDHICKLGLNECYHCKEPVCVDTYSLGHMVPWFTFEDVVKGFFDPDNGAITHKSCNLSASASARRKCDGSNTDKLAEKLGAPYHVAITHRIKQIRFGLIQQLGLDICFQCSKPITDISTLSIEHMVSWLHKDNAKELFFDLSNIRFSHLLCNTMDGRPLQTCPSNAAYAGGCRCDGCCKAHTEYQAERYQKNRESILAYMVEYHQRNKEAIAAYSAIWREKNRDSLRQKDRERYLRKKNNGQEET